MPARFFFVFYVPAAKNTLQPCLMPLLVLGFDVSMLFCTSSIHIYLFTSILCIISLQMTILALVPVKSKMCLQENLVDCADCGGLQLWLIMTNYDKL